MPASSHYNLPDSCQSQPQPDGPFELDRGYTPLQVLETKILLRRRGLPLEVIDTILDFAEYWALVSTIAQYTSERVAQSTYGNTDLEHLLYLRTQPLPGEFKSEPATGDGAIEGVTTGCLIGDYRARGQHPVRKVVFQTVSRDQGWSSNEGRGTYRGSWSWFEVHAERPNSISPADFEPLVDAEVLTKTKHSDYHDSRWKRVSASVEGEVNANKSFTSDSEQKNTWDLQRNVHAGQDWKTHWVVWEHHGPGSGPVNENTGAGMGAELVRCLKSGDRINLVARAKYPGWQNRVRSAEVHVYYAV